MAPKNREKFLVSVYNAFMEDTFHLGIKGLIRNSEGKILLLQVNIKDLAKYEGEPYWDIPGGRIERGASVEETLRREIFEETGVQEISSIEPVGMVLSNIRIPIQDGNVGLVLGVYSCTIPQDAEIALSDEHVAYEWVDVNLAKERLAIKYPQEFITSLE